jgi:signal transduction histidine kinase
MLKTPLIEKKRKEIGRLVVIYEITERKKVQKEFLRQQWIQAGMEEKERLARDLHDNLGQLLGFINLQAQGIRQELTNSGISIVSNKLDQLIEATQMAHSEIRDYIRNIRTSVFSEQDFISSFHKEINIFENQTGLTVKLDIPNKLTGGEQKPGLWINLLYIIREALNNIRKHAEAKNVKVSLHLSEKRLYTAVEDDGKGFYTNLNYNNSKTGFGLEIMKERSNEMGGEVSVKSVVGKGTKVILCVPIEEGESQDADEIDAGR